MEESDVLALGTEARGFIDEPDARDAAALQRRGKVVDLETHVVDAGTALGDEFADG